MIASREASGEFPVGPSAAIHGLDQLMKHVAGYDSTVLISGESGCGKERRRTAHSRSFRALSAVRSSQSIAAPFRGSCSESELFGHEKGAFTGALTTRIGRFELADGGTLFLDEIGDMTLGHAK